MRKIYRLIVIAIVAIIGFIGCNESTPMYGVYQTDYDTTTDGSTTDSDAYDGQADKDIPDGDENGYTDSTVYGDPGVDFNNGSDK